MRQPSFRSRSPSARTSLRGTRVELIVANCSVISAERNGGGAALITQSSGKLAMTGLGQGCSGGKRQRERTHDRVPAPVSRRLGLTMDGEMAGLPAGSNRAMPSRPRNQQCLEPWRRRNFLSQSVETLQIMPNRLAKRRLESGFIRCGCGEVLIRQEIVTGTM